MTRPGVVLMNLGAPASAAEVRAFLFRLFQDREIFAFPGGRLLQPLFAGLVALLRSPRVEVRYRSLPGGGSPLLPITRKQAVALERELALRGLGWPVEVAMRYSRPFAEDALEGLKARGADGVVGLPLYPQFSRATGGSSLNALQAAWKKSADRRPLRTVRSWHLERGLHQAIVRRVLAALEKLEGGGQTGLLFVAHSVPVRFVEQGDPYVQHVEETVLALRRELDAAPGMAELPGVLAYQSQVGPVRWVGPTVPAALRQMHQEGIRRVLVVPVSFVSDHLETLYEIDLYYRKAAFELGMERFERVESLNAGRDFIETLGDLVVGAARSAHQGEGWVTG
ncbi:MAG: ferrochelatase [bacterium]